MLHNTHVFEKCFRKKVMKNTDSRLSWNNMFFL